MSTINRDFATELSSKLKLSTLDDDSNTSTNDDASASSGRLLLASNRLPITIDKNEKGEFIFKMSSGGLVTGLSGISKEDKLVKWYGWPGKQIEEREIPAFKQQLLEEHSAVPVFVDDKLADLHYNGFSSMVSYYRSPDMFTDHLHRRNLVATPPLPPSRHHL